MAGMPASEYLKGFQAVKTCPGKRFQCGHAGGLLLTVTEIFKAHCRGQTRFLDTIRRSYRLFCCVAGLQEGKGAELSRLGGAVGDMRGPVCLPWLALSASWWARARSYTLPVLRSYDRRC